MHVEKGQAIAFANRAAIDAADLAANLGGDANRDVARNDRIRNA